jgi:imidazolonepropionase-like amidohydrolase
MKAVIFSVLKINIDSSLRNHKMSFIILNILICFSTVLAQQTSLKPSFVAFTNVNVILIEEGKTLANQTVLIKDSIIYQIGTKMKIPDNAVTIDGTGKFLMPGLIDMHAHIPPSNEFSHRKYLLMNLSAGVTSIRAMRGNPEQLCLRDSINNKLIKGPRIFVSSVPITKKQGINPVNVRDSIIRFKKVGYDFIKILSADSILYDSLISISHAYKLKVAGHVPDNDLARAIRLKQNSLEHIESLVQSFNKDSIEFKQNLKKIGTSTIFLCPDIYWYYINWQQLPLNDLKKSAALDEVNVQLVQEWDSVLNKRNIPEEKINHFSTVLKTFGRIIQLVQNEDIKLLVGSGDGLYIVPGFSMHEELQTLVKMGLSPKNALKAATVNAALFFDRQNLSGTITANKRADIILLNKNPLLDIKNIQTVDGVMVNGQWNTISGLKKEY